MVEHGSIQCIQSKLHHAGCARASSQPRSSCEISKKFKKFIFLNFRKNSLVLTQAIEATSRGMRARVEPTSFILRNFKKIQKIHFFEFSQKQSRSHSSNRSYITRDARARRANLVHLAKFQKNSKNSFF